MFTIDIIKAEARQIAPLKSFILRDEIVCLIDQENQREVTIDCNPNEFLVFYKYTKKTIDGGDEAASLVFETESDIKTIKNSHFIISGIFHQNLVFHAQTNIKSTFIDEVQIKYLRVSFL